jgi:hypothetical protein
MRGVLRTRARRDRRCARVAARLALPSRKLREPYARTKFGQRQHYKRYGALPGNALYGALPGDALYGVLPGNAQDCAIGAFIGSHGHKTYFNSDLGWVLFNGPEYLDLHSPFTPCWLSPIAGQCSWREAALI